MEGRLLGRLGTLTRALAVAGALTASASADTVSLAPSRDNTMFQDTTGSLSDGVGPVLFAGNNGQGFARRALLRFDVAGAVPPGAHVGAATLTLNVSNAPNATAHPFALHRAARDWGEGRSNTTGGSGAPADTNDATWKHAFWPDVAWSVLGGDFSPEPSATTMVGDLGVYAWSSATMAADVQAWLDDPVSAHGWVLVGDETVPTTARRFDSRENTVAPNRPRLTIDYTFPAEVAGAASGALALGPARPNPSGGAVRWWFVLPRGGRATLAVHDAGGRRVATPLDRALSAGPHEAAWDGRDASGRQVPAGIYFARLVAGGLRAPARRFVVGR
jgi:hypothetical protein